MSSVETHNTRIGTIEEAVNDLPQDITSMEYRSALRDLYHAGWTQLELGNQIGLSRWRVGQMIREAIAVPSVIFHPVRPKESRRPNRKGAEYPKDLMTDDEVNELIRHHLINSTTSGNTSGDGTRYHGDVFAEQVWKIHRERGASIGMIAARLGVKEVTLRLFMARRGYTKLPPTGSRYLKPHHLDGDVASVSASARRSPGEWVLWPVANHGSPSKDTAEDRKARFGTNPVDLGDDVQLYVDLHHVTYVRYLPGCGRRVVESMDDTDPANSHNIAA